MVILSKLFVVAYDDNLDEDLIDVFDSRGNNRDANHLNGYLDYL